MKTEDGDVLGDEDDEDDEEEEEEDDDDDDDKVCDVKLPSAK